MFYHRNRKETRTEALQWDTGCFKTYLDIHKHRIMPEFNTKRLMSLIDYIMLYLSREQARVSGGKKKPYFTDQWT